MLVPKLLLAAADKMGCSFFMDFSFFDVLVLPTQHSAKIQSFYTHTVSQPE